MAQFMGADQLHQPRLHPGVEQDMPLPLAVGVHAQQVPQILQPVNIDAQRLGTGQGVPGPAAAHHGPGLL